MYALVGLFLLTTSPVRVVLPGAINKRLAFIYKNEKFQDISAVIFQQQHKVLASPQHLERNEGICPVNVYWLQVLVRSSLISKQCIAR